ncbi:putative peroxisomal membrane protein [Botrytis fragariae]|uniref:Peroxisomal membrane protein PEX13 n=1 Tax=Botrytis fragariae TaxID=1964551 RepID=A0A8H6EH92_9HELO|nr:putative peroxisomal membrane protein [Botrytis fragariae]KAF5871830.1 putative peroxisomal membrane protein [Botrytis fragariae]
MASPPKPWERGGAAVSTALPSPAMTSTTAATSGSSAGPSVLSSTSASTSGAPAIPERPSTLTNTVNQNASAYSPYGANRMGAVGASPYGMGGMGGMGSYSSPYSRMGGMGGMGGYGYGGMGGYGSMYGGGMGGMYGNMGGMGPNDPNSLTQGFTQSTQATFQIIESVVGAFGGFAQMLESTYMATHSSFFAMVSVAEQFGNLRNNLGSILGIFTMMRWIRTLFAKITGRPMPVDATSLTPSAFASFEGRKILPDGSSPPRPSKKPFLFFIAAAFGLPYLMGKMIKALAASQEEEQKRLLASGQLMGPDGQPVPAPLDPSKLDFCRVLYDFTPESGAAVQGVDLEVKKGDLVAVISKSDPMGNPSEWWRCRARDGRMGYLPGVYLEVARRPGQPIAEIKSASQSGSRTSTMTSSSIGNANQVKVLAAPPAVAGKAGDIGVESFQKSQFYS